MKKRIEIAKQIARKMVTDAWAKRMNYCVISKGRREPPPFPTQWRDKNTFGVKFDVKVDRAAAEAWIVTALLDGYTVFHSSRRRGGFGGRSMPDIPPD